MTDAVQRPCGDRGMVASDKEHLGHAVCCEPASLKRRQGRERRGGRAGSDGHDDAELAVVVVVGSGGGRAGQICVQGRKQRPEPKGGGSSI